MRVFVINLERRKDKWNYVHTQLLDYGIEHMRFLAIDTKPGWVGCRDSHLIILAGNRDVECFMVLEDDVMILDPMILPLAMQQLPEDWDMLYLGASPKEPQERYSANLFRVRNAHVTHAIVWHNRKCGAIDYILSHKSDIKKIDDFFATEIQPRFNCFLTYPMAMCQKQFQSDTCHRSDVSQIISNYNKYCV